MIYRNFFIQLSLLIFIIFHCICVQDQACLHSGCLRENQIFWLLVGILEWVITGVFYGCWMKYLFIGLFTVTREHSVRLRWEFMPFIGSFGLATCGGQAASSFIACRMPHRSPRHLHLEVHPQEPHLSQSTDLQLHQIYQDFVQLLCIS